MLEIKNLNISFKNFSIKSLDLNVNKGEYFVLLGESGSGKSMLLECIAGMIKQDKGQLIFDGKDISNSNIQSRKIGMVYQDMNLFPKMNVEKNISYPLRIKKLEKSTITKKVYEISESLGIKHLLNRNVDTLSGGEKKRVALARTLTLEPKLLLLDEPLAALDLLRQKELIVLLEQINKSGISIVHVTHDFRIAEKLADRIAVMENGNIIQIGSVEDLKTNPSSRLIEALTQEL